MASAVLFYAQKQFSRNIRSRIAASSRYFNDLTYTSWHQKQLSPLGPLPRNQAPQSLKATKSLSFMVGTRHLRRQLPVSLRSWGSSRSSSTSRRNRPARGQGPTGGEAGRHPPGHSDAPDRPGQRPPVGSAAGAGGTLGNLLVDRRAPHRYLHGAVARCGPSGRRLPAPGLAAAAALGDAPDNITHFPLRKIRMPVENSLQNGAVQRGPPRRGIPTPCPTRATDRWPKIFSLGRT